MQTDSEPCLPMVHFHLLVRQCQGIGDLIDALQRAFLSGRSKKQLQDVPVVQELITLLFSGSREGESTVDANDDTAITQRYFFRALQASYMQSARLFYWRFSMHRPCKEVVAHEWLPALIHANAAHGVKFLLRHYDLRKMTRRGLLALHLSNTGSYGKALNLTQVYTLQYLVLQLVQELMDKPRLAPSKALAPLLDLGRPRYDFFIRARLLLIVAWIDAVLATLHYLDKALLDDEAGKGGESSNTTHSIRCAARLNALMATCTYRSLEGHLPAHFDALVEEIARIVDATPRFNLSRSLAQQLKHWVHAL